MPVPPNDNWKPWFEHIDLCNGRPLMLLPSPVTGFFLFAAPSFATQFVNGLRDDTFSGIYQLSFFDWALLVPYFAILIVLSVYGLHRYETIRVYMKHRKKLLKEPLQRFAQLPRVTLQLPLYNERFVVARLLEETCKMEYPRDLLQIQVLDDSTDETHPYTERLCYELAAQGHPIEYRHRTNRRGYKAGALQEGLETATGEFIAIFDADFIPPVDFLTRTVHYFSDPGIGVVQTRWSYLNKEYNILTQIEAMLLDGHFVLEHGARCGAGFFFNFNGTAGILRRKMIDDAGGWQHDTLTEDSDLSYRAQLKGWRFVYVMGLDCPSELPVEMHGFQVQQSRWAKGLTQVAKKLLPSILKADLPWRVKVGSVYASDAEHFLSANDYCLGADDAGDDRPVLYGMVSDAAARYAADSGFLFVHLRLLPACPARAVPEVVVEIDRVHAHAAGLRRGPHRQQHQGGSGSAFRYPDKLCAYAQICHRYGESENCSQGIPAAERVASVC